MIWSTKQLVLYTDHILANNHKTGTDFSVGLLQSTLTPCTVQTSSLHTRSLLTLAVISVSIVYAMAIWQPNLNNKYRDKKLDWGESNLSAKYTNPAFVTSSVMQMCFDYKIKHKILFNCRVDALHPTLCLSPSLSALKPMLCPCTELRVCSTLWCS